METKIKLIENTFSKSELTFLLGTLIDEKINYHKLRRLSTSEGNHHADTSHDDERIDSLKKLRSSLNNELDKIGGDVFEVVSEVVIKKK